MHSMSARALPGGAAAPGAARPAQPLAVLSLLAALLLGAATWGDWLQPLDWARREPALFHQISGYAMLGLLVFGMVFGLLRRAQRPALAHGTWLALHQGLGLLMLGLLAVHAGSRPEGFLRVLWLLLLALSALGAARLLFDTRHRPRLARLLLALHTAAACMACALVLGHLTFVYAYTR